MEKVIGILFYIAYFLLGIIAAFVLLVYVGDGYFSIGTKRVTFTHSIIKDKNKPVYLSTQNLLFDTIPQHRTEIYLQTSPDSGKIFLIGDTIEAISFMFKNQIHIYRRLDSAETLLKQIYVNGYHSHFNHNDPQKRKKI